MAFFLRLMLILIPIVALLLWIRWRMKRDLDEETRRIEFKRFRIGLASLLVALLATGLGLRFFDDGAGDVDSVYVPARVEDGKVIPGYYIPKEEARPKEKAEKSTTDKPTRSGSSSSGSGGGSGGAAG